MLHLKISITILAINSQNIQSLLLFAQYTYSLKTLANPHTYVPICNMAEGLAVWHCTRSKRMILIYLL